MTKLLLTPPLIIAHTQNATHLYQVSNNKSFPLTFFVKIKHFFVINKQINIFKSKTFPRQENYFPTLCYENNQEMPHSSNAIHQLNCSAALENKQIQNKHFS